MKKQKSNISIRQIDKSIFYLALALILTLVLVFVTVSTSYAVWVDCKAFGYTKARMVGLLQALNEIIGKDHPHHEEIFNTILFGEHINDSMTEKEYHKIALQNLKPYIVDDDDVRRRSYRIDGKLVWAVAGRCEFNDELILATVDRVTEPYNKKGLFGKVTSFFGGADSEFQKRRAETCKKELGELKYPSEFVEVYGEGRPVQGAYYDKNTKSEMITIEVSNLRIKVKWKNMKYLRKWVLEARTRENKLITNAIEDLYGIDRKKKLGIILVVGYGSGRDERVWKLRPIDEPDFRIKHDCGIVEDQELPKKLTFAVPMKVYKQKYVLSELSIDFF